MPRVIDGPRRMIIGLHVIVVVSLRRSWRGRRVRGRDLVAKEEECHIGDGEAAEYQAERDDLEGI